MEPKIFDAKIKDLKPTEKNPRQLSEKGFKQLKKKMNKYPKFITAREVVIDENMRILGGHQRVKVAEAEGKDTIRVKQVFGWTEEEKDNFIISDNVAEGEWDFDILANEWEPEFLQENGVDNIKQSIQDEKEIEEKPPTIVTSFITYEYNDEIELSITDETAVKLMEEMLKYQKEHGSYNGFWDERLK